MIQPDKKLAVGPVELEWLAGALKLADPMEEKPALENILSSLPSICLFRCPSGTEIIKEGEEGRDFYVVYSGKLSVRRKSARGGSVEIGKLAKGDFFGEIGFLLNSPRSATVSTETACRIFCFSAGEFSRLICGHAELGERIRKLALERLGRIFTREQ